MRTKFPHTLAAAKDAEKSQWAIGDALVEECGPPGDDHANNGGSKRIAAAAKFLGTNGLEYSESYLRRLRQVAFAFSDVRTRTSASWNAHEAARTPKIIDSILKGLPEGTKLTGAIVRAARDQAYDEKRRERETARDRAAAEEKAAHVEQREAADALWAATNEHEREVAERQQLAADERAEKASEEMARNNVAPKRREVSIKPQRVPAMLLAHQMNSDMAMARKAIAEATAKARARVLDLGQVNIDAIVDAALEVAEAARRFADLMRQHTPNTRGHLSVIGETDEHVNGRHA
jgi:flagellar biosynthesis GTPase FlhF